MLSELVVGVGVATILGFVAWARKRQRRKEQIKFIRDSIIWTFENIGNTKPHVDINGHLPENAIPQRAARFDHFLVQMEDVVLDHRIADLKYSEVAAIRSAVANARSLSSSSSPKDDWMDLVTYACIYHYFQKVECLNLPTKLPWRSPPDPLLSAVSTAAAFYGDSERSRRSGR